MKPLDLARRGRRARLGQQMLDTVLAADRIKEHLHRRMMEPAREHLAVVGQDLLWRPIGGQGVAQSVADCPGQRSRVHLPGVVDKATSARAVATAAFRESPPRASASGPRAEVLTRLDSRIEVTAFGAVPTARG